MSIVKTQAEYFECGDEKKAMAMGQRYMQLVMDCKYEECVEELKLMDPSIAMNHFIEMKCYVGLRHIPFLEELISTKRLCETDQLFAKVELALLQGKLTKTKKAFAHLVGIVLTKGNAARTWSEKDILKLTYRISARWPQAQKWKPLTKMQQIANSVIADQVKNSLQDLFN